MNYDKCLEERNATLNAWLENHPTVDITTLSNEVTTLSSTTTTLPPLPVCDLEKELDSVCFMAQFLNLILII